MFGEPAHFYLRREFHCFAKRRSSPIAEWWRALCRHVRRDCGGPGVGVVGVCVTGGLALALLADPPVMAPVVSQPPLSLRARTRACKQALAIADEELAAVKQRCAAGVSVLGLRLTADPFSPAKHFRRLRHELGVAFACLEIDSSPGNPHRISSMSHSVRSQHFVDEQSHPTRQALHEVLDRL